VAVVERLESRGSTCVVVLEDESLLQGLGEIRDRLTDTSSGGTAVLILDLSRLERLSSATLAAMLWARRTCYARGGRVVVRSPNRRCRDVLTRTGLATLFDIRSQRGAGSDLVGAEATT
jgi:anti-anti-sigma factor